MKTVIEIMARSVGARPQQNKNCDVEYLMSTEALEAFAELARADEREACAKVCDDFERAKWESVKNISQNGGRLAFAGPMHCAAAIRARS